MGLGKPQWLAKFEVAGFIYYGNIRELVFKIWDKPKWGNPSLFGQTDFTVGFADPMFPIRCATVVELRLQQMGTKLRKGTPLRQIWSNKSFGICGSDIVLTLYSDEKKVRENRHWKIDVIYNTTPLPRRHDTLSVFMYAQCYWKLTLPVVCITFTCLYVATKPYLQLLNNIMCFDVFKALSLYNSL